MNDLTDYLLTKQAAAEAEDTSTKGFLTDLHLVLTMFDVFGGLSLVLNTFAMSVHLSIISNSYMQLYAWCKVESI